MNRNMILPATIAAGLHAMLLGFKPTKPTPPPPAATEIVEWVPPMPPIEPPEKPVVRNDFESDEVDLPPPPAPQRADIPHLVPENPAGPVVTTDFKPDISGSNTSLIPDGIGSGPGRGLGGPISIGDLDNHPRALVRTSPTRPHGTNAAEARVTVEFIVGKDGRVVNAQIADSSNRQLEEACLRAVRLWRFEPGMKRNRPVAFRMSQEFVFNPQD